MEMKYKKMARTEYEKIVLHCIPSPADVSATFGMHHLECNMFAYICHNSDIRPVNKNTECSNNKESKIISPKLQCNIKQGDGYQAGNISTVV